MKTTFENKHFDHQHSVKTSSDVIWWERIGKSIRTIWEVKGFLINQESFILSAPQGIPWEDTFEQVVRRETSTLSSGRILRIVNPGDREPDRYCLSELCPDSFESDYWPNMSRAAYLCSDKDLLFHRHYIWVKGIREKDTFKKWIDFILEYNREAHHANLSLSAVFILEQIREKREVSGLTSLTFKVSDLDCRIFGLEKIQEISYTDSGHPSNDSIVLNSDYLLEMAVQISKEDLELCDQLLEKPENLLKQPVETVAELLQRKGQTVDLHLIESAVWKAQVIQIFPLLEQFRLELIKHHEEEIRFHLPIRDIYGEIISDPEEMEFRHMISFSHDGCLSLSAEEESKLILCRDARNTISHNNILQYKNVVDLYSICAEKQETQ